MQKLVINGRNKLSGEIDIQGAKNAALPILAAAALCKGEVVLRNCPRLSDVFSAMRILTYLGANASFEDKNTVRVCTDGLSLSEIPDNLMREMRSSIFFLGALVGRTGECRISLPGGCDIGQRPIDIHIGALRKMGVTVNERHGEIECRCEKRLHGEKISLSFPSVGATENIILAAALAQGRTEITNAAREPEIICLSDFLNCCGADIRGAGGGHGHNQRQKGASRNGIHRYARQDRRRDISCLHSLCRRRDYREKLQSEIPRLSAFGI